MNILSAKNKPQANGQTPMVNGGSSDTPQIHPIFLTQQEQPKDKRESTLDWIAAMTRLLFEGFVKLLDIVVDASIQVARLGVWVIAIFGIIIVITIITGTSAEFIDIVNSLLNDFGIEKQLSPKQ